MFRALMIESIEGVTRAAIRELSDEQLPAGEVLVDVEFSSLNYKDGLAVTGKGKVIRGELPFVPGIDLAGTVVESASPRCQPGQKVLATGWGLGEKHWGGYAGRARVRAEWLHRVPEPLTTRDTMVLGTAGLTAMLSVLALERAGVTPGKGELVVTGASGGVGSISVALLARRGFKVVASTGSAEAHEMLRALGAARIIGRDELPAAADKALDSSRWGGAIDTVGGTTLSGIVAQLAAHGAVAVCGNAGGHELHTTVYPLILRGISILGIDSNTAPSDLRDQAWRRLALDVDRAALARIDAGTISLEQVPARAEDITGGRVNGRIVVDPRTTGRWI